MNSNTLAMTQHEPLTRQKMDVDKYSLGMGLWFLKVFKIISGATTAISTVSPIANIKDRENVNPQVNFTNLFAPKCRTR